MQPCSRAVASFSRACFLIMLARLACAVLSLGSAADALRLGGARRSLREAGWFGPSEFHKQIDITKPEHEVHRAALAELEKGGSKWLLDDLHQVPAKTINAIHAMLDDARTQQPGKRGSMTSLTTPTATPTPVPMRKPRKQAVTEPSHVQLQCCSTCCPQRNSTTNVMGDRQYMWGMWKWNGQRNYNHGNTWLWTYVISIAKAANQGRHSWTSEMLKYQHPGDPWEIAGILDLFPYKLEFSPQRQKQLIPPGSALGSIKKRCTPTFLQQGRVPPWACALTIGPDMVGDAFQRALAIWPTVWSTPAPKPEAMDAVIHFRCGDIVGGSNNIKYGVPNFAWYASLVPKDAARVLIVGNFASKTSRGQDKSGDSRCALIAKEFPAFIKRKTGIDSFVVDNGSADRDFTFLAQAKTLIGSISTFSLSAALCNRRGQSFLPASNLLCLDRKTCLSLNFKRISFVPWKGLSIESGGLSKERKAMDIIRSLVMEEGDSNVGAYYLMAGQDPVNSHHGWREQDRKVLNWHPPRQGASRFLLGTAMRANDGYLFEDSAVQAKADTHKRVWQMTGTPVS